MNYSLSNCSLTPFTFVIYSRSLGMINLLMRSTGFMNHTLPIDLVKDKPLSIYREILQLS